MNQTGLLRLSQIVGDKKKNLPPIIPISKSAWWAGVKSGRFPKSVKLGPRTTCWRESEILEIVRQGPGK